MASTTLLFCFMILHCITALNAQCGHLQYTTIRNIRRSAAYNATYDLCDRGLIKDGSWYRFENLTGNIKMPEFNPGINHCGTFIPIWMKGKHPTTPGVEVDRTACAPVPWLFPPDCGDRFDIKIINCGSFFLYQLKEPKRCTYAYCAGTTLQKDCSSDGTSTPVCPGVVPVIMRPKIGPDNNTGSEFVALRCYWNYDYDASHVVFNVRWFRDSNHTQHAVEHELNGTATRNSYEDLYNAKNDAKNQTGYEWNKKVFCKVRGKFNGGNWSVWKSSQTIFTGIAIHPRVIYLHECERDKEVFVSLRPHLPIRGRPFHFEIYYDGSKHGNVVGKICVHGKKMYGRCVKEMTNIHSIYRPSWIRITAVCPKTDSAKSISNVDVKFDNQFSYKTSNSFWRSYEFLPIKISLSARGTKTCKSTTDPNIYTFDNRYYNPGWAGKEGTFRLYRNRYSGTEVQARLDKCCNCGVAIKEGYYYRIVELCSSIAAKEIPIRAKTRYTSDMAKNGFYTETTSIDFNAGQSIIVHLPSGIKVTTTRSWNAKSMDIYIKAPEPYYKQIDPNDKHRHSEGLCGNFNNDKNDDFEGLTMGEFVELHRIRPNSSEDIFAYQGHREEEERLYRECLEDHICICDHGPTVKDGVKCDRPGVIAECSPPERSNEILRSDYCRGNRVPNNGERRKRALDSRDDDIDDQDVIPLYDPPRRNITTLSWPTPSGLTEENVTEICNKRIRYSKAGESCGTVVGVDLDALVAQCISDIQITDDVLWAVANLGAMNEICKANVYKNISYYKNSTDGRIELDTNVLDSLCPNDCSDRGNCSNSTCTCFEDYTASDCSISLKDSPILYGIRKSGLCDVRRRPCRNVGIYAFPLLDSKNLTCHVQEFKVIESAWIPDSSISLYPGLMMDINEVKCFLPESPVNIGDYGNEGITAAGLMIAVSNNRVNASKESMVFITYDSVCQECNSTIKRCQLKTNACFISGHCFAQNQIHPSDWCQQCLPEISTNSWENRKDNQSPKFTTSTVWHAFRGKELRVQLNAIDPENRTIRYTLVKNDTPGASFTEQGLFTYTKNTNDSDMFIFNATDECGAYSVLHVSVVIKECLCQNSGECLPNYRYLDGAGNFTCSCFAGYTGTLCELDVDECAVLKPCLNGNCNNKKPGFSCSCYVGYTGDLCQNEIDDCTSTSCFTGVNCTDLIASFRCGPCPDGYSGNGEICARTDGRELDECVRKPEVCHTNATCAYNNRSYMCQCVDGYIGDGKNNCTDVDECIQTPNVCHHNANCTNTEGSYSCQCLVGYTGDAKLSCSDFDECTSPNVCIQNAECSNTVGSYLCRCAAGYLGDGYSSCTDINECNSNGPGVCHQDATCSNLEGSYSCQCKNGYSGDGKRNCSDIDECLTIPNICHQFAICNNIQGSYSCHCRTGFSGNGDLNCDDINECQQAPSVCHRLAKCSNTEGSFSCQCDKGFTGDGIVNCTDIDECSQSPSVCHQRAKCTNSIGFFSCQCNQGFFGDGIQSCTENQPPQFTTPTSVYAILNHDFEIKIVAVDPENQNVTFTLLSNGTLTAARISKNLLTILNLKQNGTVYVQVQDAMGAKNVLTLQVNAFECPCVHNGKCYQNRTIMYPVQPSDYLCQCEDPYAGQRCEIAPRPNPCDELPCYPGLKCFTAQNSEGFTCEECPTLFQGNGKQCELKPTEETSSVASELTLTDEEWDDQLKIKTSNVYKKLVSLLTIEIRNVYKDYAGFSYVIIKRFRPGSIIVDFELIFTKKKVEDPLKPLMKVIETGKLGNMTVIVNMPVTKNGSSDDKILGLDRTILFVIVGVAAAFILMIIVAIYFRIKRHRTHREVKVKKRIVSTSTKDSQGIAFQPTGQNSGEDIGLKVFDNEALEEDIIQP